MDETFSEVLAGLMHILWLFAIAVLLLVTLPAWVIPYTAYKLWKENT